LLSCNCGRRLGKLLVCDSARAKAFVGYVDFVSLPSHLSLTEQFVLESIEVDLAVMAGVCWAAAKSKVDAAYASARRVLLASKLAMPGDIAALDLNHAALVGPWTSREYGTF
jgi:hypothetical protein